jgi:hypothetical protein
MCYYNINQNHLIDFRTFIAPSASSGIAATYEIWSESFENENNWIFWMNGYNTFLGVEFDPCTTPTWDILDDYTTPQSSYLDIDVWEDRCNYTQTSNSGVVYNDIMGLLSCEEYSQATCLMGNSNNNMNCAGVEYVQQILCLWDE